MKIQSITAGSIAQELGWQPGDIIEKLNGARLRDALDYRYQVTEEAITVTVRRQGRVYEYHIEKDPDDDLGVTLEDTKIRQCANKCVFCFADQNPPGLRQALYFKDGDYRLSFLHGHYITMTNMGPKDLERIVTQRLSPLYISVQVTDPKKRQEMLLYGKDDRLLEKFQYLTGHGIELHAQVVLCPGWNDGDILRRTIEDIHAFSPLARTLSIVPVGLTKYRKELPVLESVTPGYARRFLEEFHSLEPAYRHGDGRPFLFLGDEWYLLAGEALPGVEAYGDVDLTENGVGQVAQFMAGWQAASWPSRLPEPLRITLCSGTLIAPYFRDYFVPILNGVENLEVRYVPIHNDFFGRDLVTVSGLLTGQDIAAQLKDRDLGELVLFTERILSETGVVTLDDWSLEDLTQALGVPVRVCGDDPEDFFQVLGHG
jgi:putative radical SAM enzyme (TIGR03279 family)